MKKNKLNQLGKTIDRLNGLIGMWFMGYSTVQATTAGSGVKEFWNAIYLVTDWIVRIGLVVMIFGIFKFISSFANDDSNGRTKAVYCMAGGAMLMAIFNQATLVTLGAGH